MDQLNRPNEAGQKEASEQIRHQPGCGFVEHFLSYPSLSTRRSTMDLAAFGSSVQHDTSPPDPMIRQPTKAAWPE
jgi:hypothetical protein